MVQGPRANRGFLKVLQTALVVAGACAAGCTLTGLEAGFSLTPPGGYFKVGQFEDRQPETQPVKVIPVEIEPSDATVPS